jgi:uncharacterized protein
VTAAEDLVGRVEPGRVAALHARLSELGSVLVAFSGGADSALLLAAAARVLGPDRVAAATAVSASLAGGERDAAAAFAADLGVPWLAPRTDEMRRVGYRPLAEQHGYAHVATGTNADDAVAGFRPGIRAASERGAVTPLLDAGLTKDDVRALSRAWGLPTWDKPAAACLSSRVAYGVSITPARLVRVDRAERAARAVLAAHGVAVTDLRVRDLGERGARVELDAAALAALAATAPGPQAAVVEAVVALGFERAEVDPRGFRSGAMNELLERPELYR